MSKGPKSARRAAIAPDWQPSPSDREFAIAQSLDDLPAIAEEFRDYHLSHGSLMLDWSAAWRTWCRNQKRWGRHVKATLLNGDAADPFGAVEFSERCKFTEPGTMEDGKVVPCVNGWDLVGVLTEVCEVAGLAPEWRGDLGPVATWLRDGIEPERILNVIRGSRPPREAGSWWAYERKMRAW